MSSDEARPRPSFKQLQELAKALEQFLWHDENSSYPVPRAQEVHRLPGFLRVADAVRLLRDLQETNGWPVWLKDFIPQVIKIFDILAYSWGWGELLKPAEARAAYIARCEERFRDSYLFPIQEAARQCRKNFSSIECPHFLEELCETVPPIDFDLMPRINHQDRLDPLWDAVYRKRAAFLLGVSYPTLTGAGGDPDEFAPDIVLGDTLKLAHRKLAQLVAKVGSETDPDAATLIAVSSGKELRRLEPDQRGAQHVPTEWMITIAGEPIAVDIRRCEIWGDGQQDDLIRMPDGRFAFGRWDSRGRRYAVCTATKYRLREASRSDVIAWCNAAGYIYPKDLIPDPQHGAQPPPNTAPILTRPQQDLPPYCPEDQHWFGALPKVVHASSEEFLSLTAQIDIVLFTATETELNAALRRVDPLAGREVILKGYAEQETYYLGTLGACPVAVTKCRMGSVGSGSAELATQHAIQIWRPRAIIMAGIAFGRDPAKQKIADVLVASEIIPYEPQRIGEPLTIYRGVSVPVSQTLLNRFENVPHWSFLRPDGSRCVKHVGPVLSGEKLIDRDSVKLTLFDSFPAAIGGEMEGAGLAAAAHRNNIPWILAKAICDWADGTKHSGHQPLAAAAMSLVHHLLLQRDVLHGLEKKTR